MFNKYLRFPRLITCLLLCGMLLLFPSMSRCAEEVPADYAEVLHRLTESIKSEQESKQLPALSICLVDDSRVVWSAGFGASDSDEPPVSSGTVYRVGSVSKLFTALAVKRLAVEGKVELDADVKSYLPEFSPENQFDSPITLRNLLSHQSGLVRETPVGSYFDPDGPSLEETVLSLNQTQLVFAPGTRTKYSNAAVSVAGRVVERVAGVPFEQYVQESILEPLQMHRSSFLPKASIQANLPNAWMWSHHRDRFPAPEFLLGIRPAANLYSTVDDLAKLIMAMISDRALPADLGLSREHLNEMILLNSAQQLEGHQYGLGFRLGELDGRTTFGHGGAVYGFATQFKGLPEERLGVVVAVALDGANGVANRIADYALRAMLAHQESRPIPNIESSRELDPGEADRLEGKYAAGDESMEIYKYGNEAYLKHGYNIGPIRKASDAFVVDDVLKYGPELDWSEEDSTILMRGKKWKQLEEDLPPECPQHLKGLIGEYGWDHNILYIYEDRGQLWALIEWFYYYPLTEVGENVFAFPESGLYHDERIVFSRNDSGEVIDAKAGGIVFPRRKPSVLQRDLLSIKPIRPVKMLRTKALQAEPPEEPGPFLEPDLVDLRQTDPTIRYDIRHATTRNFIGTPFYESSHAFLQRPAAEAVKKANQQLKPLGYGLLIYDAYRPWFVTKMLWDGVPPQFHDFVADPNRGSRHNRGCAVDLTLYDLESGEPVGMVAEYDEFSERSYPLYPGGTSRERWHRALLRKTMESASFRIHPTEWWHFDYLNWRRYPIMNFTFEELSDETSPTNNTGGNAPR